MTPEERELLKEELRAELMEEFNKKSHKQVQALVSISKKWFNGPNKNFKWSDSKMQRIFGSHDQHKVYEAIRTLTRLIFGKSVAVQLRDEDQKEVEKVANAICELVYSLKVNQQKAGD